MAGETRQGAARAAWGLSLGEAPAATRKYDPGVEPHVPLVLSERDYKLLTLFTKIAGIFTFAAGTVTLIDKHIVGLGLLLLLLGTVVTLAPVPMTVVRPDTYPGDEDEEQLTVNE